MPISQSLPQGWSHIFVWKWLQRAKQIRDPFDRFFSAWLALIVAAEHFRRVSHIPFSDGDRKKILDYFRGHEDDVLHALRICDVQMRQLANRKGSRHRDEILDTRSVLLRPHLRHLVAVYAMDLPGPDAFQGTAREPDSETVEAVGELLIRVRNNVFHGIKVPDNEADIELLNLVTPLIICIVKTCQH